MMSEMYIHSGIREMLHQMVYDIDCEVNEIAARDGDVDAYSGFADVCNDEIYHGLCVSKDAIVYLIASAVYQFKCREREKRPGMTSETGFREEKRRDKADKAR